MLEVIGDSECRRGAAHICRCSSPSEPLADDEDVDDMATTIRRSDADDEGQPAGEPAATCGRQGRGLPGREGRNGGQQSGPTPARTPPKPTTLATIDSG